MYQVFFWFRNQNLNLFKNQNTFQVLFAFYIFLKKIPTHHNSLVKSLWLKKDNFFFDFFKELYLRHLLLKKNLWEGGANSQWGKFGNRFIVNLEHVLASSRNHQSNRFSYRILMRSQTIIHVC